MQEVSKRLTFQGGIQEWNIESDADGDIRVHGKCPPEHWLLLPLEMEMCNSRNVSNVSVMAIYIDHTGLFQG